MAEMTEPVQAEKLISLLTQQRDLYQRLQQLAEQQRSLIASDRPESLLNVLKERQTLVGKLAQLNMQLAPYRRNWHETYNGLSDEVRQQAGKLLEEINGMLQTILSADREDSALLSARKQVIANELNDVSGGRKVNAAYAQQTAKPGGSTADISG
jgi:Mg2+ and Co2+ transporter CorA